MAVCPYDRWVMFYAPSHKGSQIPGHNKEKDFIIMATTTKIFKRAGEKGTLFSFKTDIVETARQMLKKVSPSQTRPREKKGAS